MKKIIVSALAFLSVLAIAVPALADNDKNENLKKIHDVGTTLEVHINDNGTVLVRGAKVTAVSGNTLNANTAWGAASLSWTVNTDNGTKFVRKSNGASSIGEVSVGDLVSFQGNLVTTGSGLVVNAKTVKDWSVQKLNATFNGTVQSVSTSSFVLATNERGNLTVNVVGSTSILKGNVAGAFADITVGASVQAKGVWDTQANTLLAERVVIKLPQEPKQGFNFFEGKIKSIAGTVAPTTMVVTVGNIDYTVSIAANISILNNLWLSTNLANFRVGDHVRFYGTLSGTTISATVVRDTSVSL